MKVNLVVATGVHQGKVIPIIGPQFVIGRDPQCHLRPASQAVSKQHCAIIVRDGQVYLQEYGSTNGTLLNDTLVKGQEVPLRHNDSIKIGPLDFTLQIELTPMRQDGTPLPDMNPEAAAALAAVKAVAAKTAPRPAGGSRDVTPSPLPPKAPVGPKPAAQEPPAKAGSKESPALKGGSKESPALKTGSKESPAVAQSQAAPAPAAAAPEPETVEVDEQDRLAAMLLGLDDDVPGGSTVVDAPILNSGADTATQSPAAGGQGQGGSGDSAKAPDAKKAAAREDTSSAASDLLRKYMRRPK